MDFLRGGDMLSAGGTLTVANNLLVVAAVSNQRIRVFGYSCGSNTGAFSTIQFKSASGGTMISGIIGVPHNTIADLVMPIANSGLFETNTGEGLYVDNGLAISHLCVFYKVYTP